MNCLTSFSATSAASCEKLSCTLALLLAFAISPLHGADKRRDSANGKTPVVEPAPQGKGFESFQLLTERNIFNPNRVGRTREVPQEKPPRVEEISLVGTMQYDKGPIAFFDSPDASYRKTVRTGESVGDFKVARISAEGVELLREDKPVELKVAQQLRRVEGGEWTVSVPASSRGDSRGTTSASASQRSNEPPPPVEIPANASETLKRLMKNRDKQLK